MRNGIRLLLVLSLACSLAGCTSLVNIARPLATNRVGLEPTRLVETNLPETAMQSIALEMSQSSKREPEVLATRAPIVVASALELDEKGIEAHARRQRDLNFAKAQKRAIAKIEQQRRTIDEPLERTIHPACSEVTSTGSIAQASVSYMATCAFTSEISATPIQGVEDYGPGPIASEPQRSGLPIKFATIVALVLGSVTLPLARLYREPGSRDGRKEPTREHMTPFSSASLQPPTIASEPELAQYSSLCISNWAEVDLFSNCAMIDPGFADCTLAAQNSDSKEKSSVSRAVILSPQESMPARIFERQKRASPGRELIVYRKTQVCAQGPTAHLHYTTLNGTAFQCTELSIRFKSELLKVIEGPAKGSLVGPLIESQNRQLGTVRGIQGVLVLFTEDNEVATVKRVLIVESCSINEESELTAKVVSVA